MEILETQMIRSGCGSQSRGPLLWWHGPVARYLYAVLCLGLIWILATIPSAHADAAPSMPYRGDQILVKPKAQVPLQRLTALHATHHSKVLQMFPHAGGLQVVSVPPGQSVSGLVAEYTRSGLVEYAEPDF